MKLKIFLRTVNFFVNGDFELLTGVSFLSDEFHKTAHLFETACVCWLNVAILGYEKFQLKLSLSSCNPLYLSIHASTDKNSVSFSMLLIQLVSSAIQNACGTCRSKISKIKCYVLLEYVLRYVTWSNLASCLGSLNFKDDRLVV